LGESDDSRISIVKHLRRSGFWLAIGAVCGFVAVALGAFGAHGLRDLVGAERLITWDTATEYLGLHALAILGCGLWLLQRPGDELVNIAGVAFLSGILVFSGSLFLLVLTGYRLLGMATPIGGLLLLAGWAILAAAARRIGRIGGSSPD
jgi:uncharacterized membrane protein YgdD (TMEM256/DUF423 family)